MIERVRAVLRKLAQSKPEPLSEVEIAIGVYLHIQTLRNGEGSAVEVLCDNPGHNNGHASNAVICSGEWTGWELRRYEADSLLGALRLAVLERQQTEARQVHRV
jgi:hypothetical protein